MNRPYAYMGLAALAGSFLFRFSPPLAIIILFAVSAAVIILSLKNKRSLVGNVLTVLVALLLIVGFVSGYVSSSTAAKVQGRKTQANITLQELIYDGGDYKNYSVKIERSNLSSIKGMRAVVTFRDFEDLQIGDEYKAVLSFKDEASVYIRSEGIYLSANCLELDGEYIKHRTTLYRLADDLRRLLGRGVESIGISEETGVMKALLIGDKEELTDEIEAKVKNAGVSHILVVSGMHLSIICGVLLIVLEYTGLSRRRITVISGLMIAFMTVASMFHISILRAALTYLIFLLGRLIFRNADGLNSLGLATVLLCAASPMLAYNVAFMLSASATFAVIYPAGLISRRIPFYRISPIIRWPLVYAFGIIVASVSALICTLPIVAYTFGEMSVIAPITNLAVDLCVTAALIVGVIGLLLYMLPLVGGIFSFPFLCVCRWLTGLFMESVEFFGRSSATLIEIEKDKNIYCILIVVAFILLVRYFCRKGDNFRVKR